MKNYTAYQFVLKAGITKPQIADLRRSLEYFGFNVISVTNDTLKAVCQSDEIILITRLLERLRFDGYKN